MKCDRCQIPTFDHPITLFDIYHALLCRDCRNDFEVWVREQNFWTTHRRCEAQQICENLNQSRHSVDYVDVYDNLTLMDNNKLTAYPLIEAWVKAGKVEENKL